MTMFAPEAEEEVKRLVPMVECRIEGDQASGAGIAFGSRKDTVYVATAEHVVRPCRQPGGTVVLRFRNHPSVQVPARISAHSDAELDLTVLEADVAQGSSLDLPFDRLGDPASLVRGSRVYSLGWRNRPWALNSTPEPVSEHTAHRVYYESNFIGPGHSGGALLDDNMLILGMLRSEQPPLGEAIGIDRVLDRARQWIYPVSLRAPYFPDVLHLLTAGAQHVCGLDLQGQAFCLGGSQYHAGELGTGTSGAKSKRVVGGTKFLMLTGADGATCGVAKDGNGYCWGRPRNAPFGAGAYSLAPTIVDKQLRFRSLTVAMWHACGIASDHSAWCWGQNDMGQLGSNTTDFSRVPVRVAGTLTFSAISAGESHTCGLTVEGQAYCWGNNLSGEGGGGTSEKALAPARVAGDLRFRSISTSAGRHTCGIAVEGDAYCWGDNSYGQAGTGDRGDSLYTPAAVAGGHKFATLAAGASHSCGIDLSGRAYCWGSNEQGQLGTGYKDSSLVPAPVAGGLRFQSLTAHGTLTCGLTYEGTPYCWGSIATPAAGDGALPATVPARTPRRIAP